MKKKIARLLLYFIVFLVTSCATIGYQIMKPMVDVIFIPLTNEDLATLQWSLFYYRGQYQQWPSNVIALLGINKNDSINVNLANFNILTWVSVGDSLLVDYSIKYSEADTMQYRYLKGKFYISPNTDSLQVSHFQIKGESKDGKYFFGTN